MTYRIVLIGFLMLALTTFSIHSTSSHTNQNKQSFLWRLKARLKQSLLVKHDYNFIILNDLENIPDEIRIYTTHTDGTMLEIEDLIRTTNTKADNNQEAIPHDNVFAFHSEITKNQDEITSNSKDREDPKISHIYYTLDHIDKERKLAFFTKNKPNTPEAQPEVLIYHIIKNDPTILRPATYKYETEKPDYLRGSIKGYINSSCKDQLSQLITDLEKQWGDVFEKEAAEEENKPPHTEAPTKLTITAIEMGSRDITFTVTDNNQNSYSLTSPKDNTWIFGWVNPEKDILTLSFAPNDSSSCRNQQLRYYQYDDKTNSLVEYRQRKFYPHSSKYQIKEGQPTCSLTLAEDMEIDKKKVGEKVVMLTDQRALTWEGLNLLKTSNYTDDDDLLIRKKGTPSDYTEPAPVSLPIPNSPYSPPLTPSHYSQSPDKLPTTHIHHSPPTALPPALPEVHYLPATINPLNSPRPNTPTPQSPVLPVNPKKEPRELDLIYCYKDNFKAKDRQSAEEFIFTQVNESEVFSLKKSSASSKSFTYTFTTDHILEEYNSFFVESDKTEPDRFKIMVPNGKTLKEHLLKPGESALSGSQQFSYGQLRYLMRASGTCGKHANALYDTDDISTDAPPSASTLKLQIGDATGMSISTTTSLTLITTCAAFTAQQRLSRESLPINSNDKRLESFDRSTLNQKLTTSPRPPLSPVSAKVSNLENTSEFADIQLSTPTHQKTESKSAPWITSVIEKYGHHTTLLAIGSITALASLITADIWRETRNEYDAQNGAGSFAQLPIRKQIELCCAHLQTRFAPSTPILKAQYDAHHGTNTFDTLSDATKNAVKTEAACNRWWAQFDNKVTELPISVGIMR